MDLAIIVAVIAALFIVIGLSEPLADTFRVPSTVVLAMFGIALGAGAAFFLRTELTDALNPVAIAILNLPIRSNVFLYVFLPTLIFQVALSINLRRMMDDWVPILVLAVVAVAVATVVIGYALFPFAGLPLMACLLIGAIVSTTDPSAVVSIFRGSPAPQRLARIVEGESLLNDAAAIVLFGLFLSFVSIAAPDPNLGQALARFPLLVLGGAFTGWIAAMICLQAIRRMPEHTLGQISISVALPYLAYIAAEQLLGASGVIAVVVAGLTINITAPGILAPPAMSKLRDTWDLMAYWAGSLIFVLAALLIPRLLADVRVSDLFLVGIVVVAAFTARAIILFGLMPLLSAVRMSPRVDAPYRLAILWGGLRGAVTLALALAVTESFLVAPEVKRQVAILATGFTLFTLIVQGATLRPAIRWLGLDQLSPLDTALSDQVVAVALQEVREDVAETARDFGLTRETVRDEAKRFAARLDQAVAVADARVEIPDRERVTLGLVALAGRERDLVLEKFRDQTIGAALAERMISDADRLIERTRAGAGGAGGRSEYRASARIALRQGRGLRLAARLHNRLGISRPLARLTADRFEHLVTLSLILRQLHGFIDRRILRIHGRRVADLLHELVQRREEETSKELDGLRLQFPGYAEELERRLIRQTTLRLEAREYEMLTEDGLIGLELRSVLMAQIAKRRRAITVRPPLDLALQKADLVRRFPLFEGMGEIPLRRLVRRLRTRYAAPGQVILKRDSTPKEVWFIASGAVEAVTAGQRHRLGPGEMFGQLAILVQARRRVQVTAITHCTLLALDEARFIDLLKRNAAVRKAVVESAERRGVKIDLAAMGYPVAVPPARKEKPSATGLATSSPKAAGPDATGGARTLQDTDQATTEYAEKTDAPPKPESAAG